MTFTQYLYLRDGTQLRSTGSTAGEWEQAAALDREWLSAPPNQLFTVTVDGVEVQVVAGDILAAKLEGGPQ